MEKQEIVARLMAMENLRVEHRKVSTAYFELKNRVLVLPMFKKDMPEEVYDLLVGHEVGHALETPPEGWHDAILPEKLKTMGNSGKGFKSFLNVVEDARIERLIKNRYPGLRKQFFAGYNHLFNEGFFGPDASNPESLLLIDRINLYYKVGALTLVTFTPEERKFLVRIETAKTWNDVVEISTDLYNYCLEELKNRNFEDNDQWGQGDSDDDFEDYSDDFDNFDDFEDDEEEDGESETRKQRGPSAGYDNDELESLTDKAFRNNEQSLRDGETRPLNYVELPMIDTDDFIVPYKTVMKYLGLLDNFARLHPGEKSPLQQFQEKNLYKDFLDKNGKYIGYLVKEFELRKNAAQLAKARQHKTGALDTNKLFSYRFNDELFKTFTTVQNGKSHGMQMVIDWSGSMSEHLAATIEQVLVLVAFCRKVNIPFEVYAFLSYHLDDPISKINVIQKCKKYGRDPLEKDSSRCAIRIGDNVQLAQVLSSKMSRQDFSKAFNSMLLIAERNRVPENAVFRNSTEMLMQLGGTPLNETLIVLRFTTEKFRIQNKVDIVNTIVLTDGQGNFIRDINSYWNADYCYIDPITKKQVIQKELNNRNSLAQMKAFAELIRQVTNSNMIGFYISGGAGTSALSAVSFNNEQRDSYRSQLTKNKFAVSTELGFNEFYVVKGSKLEIEDEALQVKTDATKNELLKAFKQNQNKKSLNRILLNRFIRAIA